MKRFFSFIIKLLNIRFEEAGMLPSLRAQANAKRYMKTMVSDSGFYLQENWQTRMGVQMGWLALLVCFWVACCSGVLAADFSKAKYRLFRANTEAWLAMQREVTIPEMVKNVSIYKENIRRANAWLLQMFKEGMAVVRRRSAGNIPLAES